MLPLLNALDGRNMVTTNACLKSLLILNLFLVFIWILTSVETTILQKYKAANDSGRVRVLSERAGYFVPDSPWEVENSVAGKCVLNMILYFAYTHSSTFVGSASVSGFIIHAFMLHSSVLGNSDDGCYHQSKFLRISSANKHFPLIASTSIWRSSYTTKLS